MTEQEIARRFIAEMQSFLHALHQRLERVTDAALPGERATTVRELRGLADAMSTLCSSFHVTDCASLGATLAGTFERGGDALPASEVVAAIAVLDHIGQRIEHMATQQRILPAVEEDSIAAATLEASLLWTDRQPGIPKDAGVAADPRTKTQQGATNGDLLELVRRFQASPLKRRETPTQQAVSVPRPATRMSEPRQVTAEELDIIPDELKGLFVRETKEDLNDLHQALLHLEKEPDDIATVADMGRVAHKIKGAAATYGFDELATLTHIFEDHIKALQSRRVAIGPGSLGYLFRCLGLLETTLAAAEAQQPADPMVVAQARILYDELVSAAPRGAESGLFRASVSLPDIESLSTPRGQRPSEGEPLLRVDVARLDALMSQVNALTMNRATIARAREEVVRLQSEMDLVLERLTQLSRQLTDLHPLVRQWVGRDTQQQRLGMAAPGTSLSLPGGPTPKVASNGYNGNGSPTRWDELQLDRYTDFDDSLRGLSEAVADMTTVSGSLRILLHRLAQASEGQGNIAQQIQQDVMQIRLVPLQSLVPRLQFPARKLADDLGKAVNFTVRGELTEIDRDVSEALAEPLSQLVRNAIVHGIESREERREVGKPEAGNVWLHAHYDGNEVSIEIGDDGRGVNPNLLRASAIAAGLLDPTAAQELSAEQALDFMFYSGISGLDQVGVTAGRGIGLDEVRTDIERLKGTITVQSQQGQGSNFHIHVPISLSIVHVLHIHTQGQGFALPFSYVLRTLPVTSADVTDAPAAALEMPNSGARLIRVKEPIESTLQSAEEMTTIEEIPLLSLSEMLGYGSAAGKEQLAVLLEFGQRRLALAVEQVVEERDIVVRALPSHLRRKAIRGASVTSDGGLLLLLDVQDLMAPTTGKAVPRPGRAPVRTTETAGPRVLVVDDSVFIRRTLELTLSRGGYEVQTARDGVEALGMMMESLPRVLILDIEMPRLDGFELLSVLRGSEQFAGLRVAMLTSRGGERHRELALSLGADDYLIKPCPQELLLGTVQRLIMEAPVNV
ncbi:MAG TPA: response regulator [Ktedonobacterales bacterium]|nr:response regulator [Ktedonobacterales bacterium]